VFKLNIKYVWPRVNPSPPSEKFCSLLGCGVTWFGGELSIVEEQAASIIRPEGSLQ
jgi:hypothetical protein